MNKNFFFDLEYYSGGRFQYQYQSQGKDVMVNVVIDGLNLLVDGQDIGLDEDDFIGCEDIDDCTLVIGRRVIKNNDGEVLTRFLEGDNHTLTYVNYVKLLDKDLKYINNTEEDSWYLTLRGDVSRDITQFNFCEVEEDSIEEITSMFEEEDTDSLFDYVISSDSLETIENFQVWGDPREEQLSYEITNENGDPVREGRIVVSEYNIHNYNDIEPYFIVDKTKHPKYLLVHSDVMKRSYSGFKVPKEFNIGEIHFIDKCPVVSRCLLDLDRFGDKMTDIFSFRYQGKTYECEDYGDNGSVGDYNFTLLEWDETKNRYNILHEI